MTAEINVTRSNLEPSFPRSPGRQDVAARRWAGGLLASLWAGAGTTVAAQQVDPTVDEHLAEPRIEWIGRYDREQPTIERLKAFVEAEGYETFGGHEEEYIVGPTMAGPGNPDEYRTILRYRVREGS